MKRKITLILLAIILAAACFTLAACGEELSAADYFGKDEYTYENEKQPPLVQEGFTIDGSFDEEAWDEVNWYEPDFSEENRRVFYNGIPMSEASVKMALRMTDKGMYVAAEVKDDVIFTEMYWQNKLVYVPYNTGIDLFFADVDYGAAYKIGEWQITASGRNAMQKGREGWGGAKYQWPAHTASIATVIDAPEGRTKANGYRVEAFVGYENLPFDSKPEYYHAFIGLNRIAAKEVEENKTTRRVFECGDELNGINTADRSTWKIFNSDTGYVSNLGDADQSILGNEEYWDTYSGKTLEVLSYDKTIYDANMRTNNSYAPSWVAGTDYTAGFDPYKEKGMEYQAQLIENDGLYYRVKVRHNHLLYANENWGEDNNVEAKLTSTLGYSQTVQIYTKDIDADGNVTAGSNFFCQPKIVINDAPAGSNYKYESYYYGYVPYKLLEVTNMIHDGVNGKHVRFGLCYRSGVTSNQTVAIPLADLVGDGGSVTDITSATNLEGNYTLLTGDAGKWTPVKDNMYIDKTDDGYRSLRISTDTNGPTVELRRAQYAAYEVNGVPSVIFYVDYPEINDSIYSLGAHTTQKPFIWYPFGYSPYTLTTRPYVTSRGIEGSYYATEAVVDGKADDEIWTNYNGYTSKVREQTDESPSANNINKAGIRGIDFKAVKGEKGIYIFATVRSKNLSYATHKAHWVSNLELSIALTPDNPLWNNAHGNAAIDPTTEEVYNQPAYYLYGVNLLRIGRSGTTAQHEFISSQPDQYGIITSNVEAFIPFEVMAYEGHNVEREGIPDGYDFRIGYSWRTIDEFMGVHGIGSGTAKATNQWYDTQTHFEWKRTEAGYVNVPKFMYVTENGLTLDKGATAYVIDGDDSDWQNYAGITQTIQDQTSGSKKYVSHRAVMKPEGLYYVSKATTATFFVHGKNGAGTQLIIRGIVDNADKEIFVVRSAGLTWTNSITNHTENVHGNLRGCMNETVAVKRPDGLYDITMEGFIPAYILEMFGIDKNNSLIGFEFNPSGSGSWSTLEPFSYHAAGQKWRNWDEMQKTTPSAYGKLYATENGLSLTK